MICYSLTFNEVFEVPAPFPSTIMSLLPLIELSLDSTSKIIATSLPRLKYSQIEKSLIGILDSIPRDFCLTTVLQQNTSELDRSLHFISAVLRDEHLVKSQIASGLKCRRASFCFWAWKCVWSGKKREDARRKIRYKKPTTIPRGRCVHQWRMQDNRWKRWYSTSTAARRAASSNVYWVKQGRVVSLSACAYLPPARQAASTV